MSGGGTAGHVYPALSVAEVLVADGDDVTFIGTPNGVESRLAMSAGLPFLPLRASGFDRSRPWTLLTSSVRILMSALRARWWFGRSVPDVIVGFGGYVSIPVGLAAWAAGIPLVLHEQNSVPGLANRFLSRYATTVCVTYESSIPRLARARSVVLTGNPVRPEVLTAERAQARRQLGIAGEAVVVLAFGGSRGARHLNSALVSARETLLRDPAAIVLHAAGPLEYETVVAALDESGGDGGGRWRVVPYFDDMASTLAAADIVICRAGATSIAEVTSRGIAAVLVPFPFATDDHQTSNAAAVAAAGGAVVLADAELDGEGFSLELGRLIEDSGLRATMAAASRAVGRPDAAARVAAVIRDALEESTKTRSVRG